MNWKQQLAEFYGYKSFEEMDTSDQETARKAVEFYSEQLVNIKDAKKQNDGFGVPGIPENESGQTSGKEENKIPWDWATRKLQEWNGPKKPSH